MTQLHTDILTTQARKQLKKLKHFSDDFYLAGGTALALQINHRVSVDFDFFSPEHIKKTLLPNIEEIFVGSIVEVLLNNPRELTLVIDGVKYTFLHYPFPVLQSFVNAEDIRLLSVEEILVTKAYSIGRRGSFKDYVDMYIGLKNNHTTLARVIELAMKKYGETFNDRLFLEQLLFLDDVEEIKILMRAEIVPSRQVLVDFFTQAIRSLQLL